LGTPLYAAPEIFSTVVRYDYKVDIWALGIILFELIFGYNPFQAEDVATLTQKQIAGP
jgi:serine/threonine protein kinase